MENNYIESLITFLDNSTCNFWAVETVRNKLLNAGYEQLNLAEQWHLKRGGKYLVTKNDSAIFAFVVGEGEISDGFKIISAHSDSPGFRIKPNPEIVSDGGVVKLNTEVYGGPILYTWFDRPLSISGRVILRSVNPLHPEHLLVKFDRPLLTIPHLAIHFNRQVNEGSPLSRQKDMLPIIGRITESFERDNMILNLIADELKVDVADILDFDLTLYDTTKACLVGLHNEYITSGRLDDLSMAHAAMTALIESQTSVMTQVVAIFDNEETGSGTKQGAASPVLKNILHRIAFSLDANEEEFLRGIANSFMISADNAHAVHPNYIDKYDPTNHPVMGNGPVIKINANCKYMTDADSAAVFRKICEDAQVPFQYFVNHSDVAGGSTLGNILTSQMDIRGVDMGNALWAMHSVRETASVDDHIFAIKAFSHFFNL